MSMWTMYPTAIASQSAQATMSSTPEPKRRTNSTDRASYSLFYGSSRNPSWSYNLMFDPSGSSSSNGQVDKYYYDDSDDDFDVESDYISELSDILEEYEGEGDSPTPFTLLGNESSTASPYNPIAGDTPAASSSKPKTNGLQFINSAPSTIQQNRSYLQPTSSLQIPLNRTQGSEQPHLAKPSFDIHRNPFRYNSYPWVQSLDTAVSSAFSPYNEEIEEILGEGAGIVGRKGNGKRKSIFGKWRGRKEGRKVIFDALEERKGNGKGVGVLRSAVRGVKGLLKGNGFVAME